MSGRTYTVSFDIDGFVASSMFPRDYNIFRRDDGSAMTPVEARAHLAIEKAKGHVVIPYSRECGNPCRHDTCPGFDYSGRGCGGRVTQGVAA